MKWLKKAVQQVTKITERLRKQKQAPAATPKANTAKAAPVQQSAAKKATPLPAEAQKAAVQAARKSVDQGMDTGKQVKQAEAQVNLPKAKSSGDTSSWNPRFLPPGSPGKSKSKGRSL